MATIVRSYSEDRPTSKLIKSRTGHLQSPARNAPMSAKMSQRLSMEQTSEGAVVEARRLNHSKKKKLLGKSKTEDLVKPRFKQK